MSQRQKQRNFRNTGHKEFILISTKPCQPSGTKCDHVLQVKGQRHSANSHIANMILEYCARNNVTLYRGTLINVCESVFETIKESCQSELIM